MNGKFKYKAHTGVHIHRKNPRVKQGTSKEEIGLFTQIVMDFPTLKVYRSDRQVLNGKEIDIYIPSCHLGVEYNGNRWHSSAMDKSPNYHLNKSIMAERKGVRLIHIFSDMWESRKTQVIDLIRKQLGKYKTVSAKKCSLAKLSEKEGYDFINKCYVNEPDRRPDNYIGYIMNDKIIAVLAYNEKDKIIYEYQDIYNIKIDGAIDKILKTYPELEEYKVYCDRSLLKQDFWKNEGYVPIDCTKPRTYYTKDFKSRIRSDFIGISEQKLQESGFKTIYDCGEIILKKKCD